MKTKTKKSTRLKDESTAAVSDGDSACPRKKKMKKSVRPEAAAAGAAAGHSFSSVVNVEEEKEGKKKKGKEKKKKKKKNKKEKGKMPDGDDDRWPSLYLVIQHAVVCPAYSLYKVTLTAKTTGDHPVPSPCRIKYLDAEHEMSFAAVSSEQRSWIVGVGGCPSTACRAETIVFDCRAGMVVKGPRLTESKFSPIAVAIGEKIYALAHMPSICMPPDFPPWFEVLDVSAASCIDGQLTDCAWRPLPSPPLFPIVDEEGTRADAGAPLVEVESYAVVGNYILISIVRDPFTERDAGTVAFDVGAEEWHYVDHQKNLPFIGQAFPYGDGDLFLGRSKSEWNFLTGWYISVAKINSSLVLSIRETSDPDDALKTILRTISGQFLYRLGNGVICSVGCCTQGWFSEEELKSDNICIDFYGLIKAGEDEAESQRDGKIVLSSNSDPSKYFFRLKEPVYQLIAPSLVSALWMDAV